MRPPDISWTLVAQFRNIVWKMSLPAQPDWTFQVIALAAGAAVAAADPAADPRPLSAVDLRLEAESHAVLLPDKGVAGQPKRLLEDGARRVAVEEEVRRSGQPEAAPAVDRDLFERRARTDALAEERRVYRATELDQQRRD